jgi:hypothetical protein
MVLVHKWLRASPLCHPRGGAETCTLAVSDMVTACSCACPCTDSKMACTLLQSYSRCAPLHSSPGVCATLYSALPCVCRVGGGGATLHSSQVCSRVRACVVICISFRDCASFSNQHTPCAALVHYLYRPCFCQGQSGPPMETFVKYGCHNVPSCSRVEVLSVWPHCDVHNSLR